MKTPPPKVSRPKRFASTTNLAAGTLILALLGGLLWWRLRPVQRATAADCQVLLDAVVRIELREQGYQDPALERLRSKQLRKVLRSQLQGCVGRPLPAGALRCAATAKSSEELSHGCLGGSQL